jgi:hypothetical protein
MPFLKRIASLHIGVGAEHDWLENGLRQREGKVATKSHV